MKFIFLVIASISQVAFAGTYTNSPVNEAISRTIEFASEVAETDNPIRPTCSYSDVDIIYRKRTPITCSAKIYKIDGRGTPRATNLTCSFVAFPAGARADWFLEFYYPCR